MSTGCECLFIEIEPKKWYYVLEDYNAPKNSWDWMEYARAYGPFTTEEKAEEHLFDNHANPGSSCTQEYSPDYKPSETLKELIASASSCDRRQWWMPTPGY